MNKIELANFEKYMHVLYVCEKHNYTLGENTEYIIPVNVVTISTYNSRPGVQHISKIIKPLNLLFLDCDNDINKYIIGLSPDDRTLILSDIIPKICLQIILMSRLVILKFHIKDHNTNTMKIAYFMQINESNIKNLGVKDCFQIFDVGHNKRVILHHKEIPLFNNLYKMSIYEFSANKLIINITLSNKIFASCEYIKNINIITIYITLIKEKKYFAIQIYVDNSRTKIQDHGKIDTNIKYITKNNIKYEILNSMSDVCSEEFNTVLYMYAAFCLKYENEDIFSIINAAEIRFEQEIM